MRAGSLDKTITIQSRVVGDGGSETDTWLPVATVRAMIVKASTEETPVIYNSGRRANAIGDGGTVSVTFRTRYLGGVTTDNRMIHEGRSFDVREVQEIGRRRGLELRCEEIPA